ncbi:MAG: hypothetical protein JWR16_3 [Nevskia sp.]|nr:hypothetical protein [Nevskia sp.]
MLIRNAELDFGERVDLRIEDAHIAAIDHVLRATAGEIVIDAAACALLPGLNDHHLHLAALAAAQVSVQCGPPQVHSAEELGAALRKAAAHSEAGWIRGVGYHESVAGEIDRDWLDRIVDARPLRIQHRSGRLWILNTAALAEIGAFDARASPLQRSADRISGRLYDADAWLRSRLRSQRPNLQHLSRQLASYGVVGVTDTSHDNDLEALRYFADAQASGELLQDVFAMGNASLDQIGNVGTVLRGPHKFHLHEHELPPFEPLCAMIRASHGVGRAVAFHCVSRTELVFALAALREAGAQAGDRIEHSGVTPPEALQQMAELGVTVVTQPSFIAERGDAYLQEVDADDVAWLYRLQSFDAAGVALAGSTDAPYASADPWAAMQAAVTRRTPSGQLLGVAEALRPERAFALFSGAAQTPAAPRRIAVGAVADLCLLDRPWRQARDDLAAVRVRLTLRRGQTIFSVAIPS